MRKHSLSMKKKLIFFIGAFKKSTWGEERTLGEESKML